MDIRLQPNFRDLLKQYCAGKYLDFCSPEYMRLTLKLLFEKKGTKKFTLENIILTQKADKEKQRRLKLKNQYDKNKMTQIYRQHFLDRHF